MKYELTQKEVDRLAELYISCQNTINEQYRNGVALRRYFTRAVVRLYYVNLWLAGLYNQDRLQASMEVLIAKTIQKNTKKLFDFTRKPVF